VTRPIAAHLVVDDPELAADWYAKVLAAEETSRIPLPGGGVLTIELSIGPTTIALASEHPGLGIVSPKTLGGTYGALVIDTDDADALWSARSQTAPRSFHPIADTFWGERFGQIIDPFGHRWGFAQHLRDVPHAEVVKAAAEMFR
jgi:PhnB protein